jgi:hypothetical protein
MNKKVIFILILTLVALVVLYLYSFGPWAGVRASGNFNPASLRLSDANSLSAVNKSETFGTYQNKDVKENYYVIQLPRDWRVSTGKDPGSYAIAAANANVQLGLMDVPDNSTLELYVLSQDEPRLRQSLAGYSRIEYTKESINGNEAYRLIYVSRVGGDTYQTIREYIAGQDHAALMVLTSKQSYFPNMQPTFNSIINSFNWQNK